MFLFYSVYLMTLTKNNAHTAACIAAEIYSARHAPADILRRQGVIAQAVCSIAK